MKRSSSSDTDAGRNSANPAKRPDYLADHVVHGMVVVPGAALVDMMLTAAHKRTGSRVLENVAFTEPLIRRARPRRVQVRVTGQERGAATLQVLSAPRGEESARTLHATASLPVAAEAGAPADFPRETRDRGTVLDIEHFYDSFAAKGIEYGPMFRGARKLWKADAGALGLIEAPRGLVVGNHALHPALLDAAFQIGGALQDGEDDGTALLPVAIDHLRLDHAGATSLYSYVRRRERGRADGAVQTFDIVLFDEDERQIGEVRGLHLQRATKSTVRQLALRRARSCQLALRWEERALTDETARGSGRCLILVDSDEGFGEQLAAELRTIGWRAEVGSLAAVAQGDATAYSDVIDCAFLSSAAADADDPLGELERQWERIRRVVGALSQTSAPPELWLLTRGSQHIGGQTDVSVDQAALWGIARTLRLEHPRLVCRCIDLDPYHPEREPAELQRLARLLTDAGNERELALRGAALYVPRLTPLEDGASAGQKRFKIPTSEAYALDFAERGQLENLRLRPATRRRPGPEEVEVQVKATGLNFRDVMNVLGTYPGDAGRPGGECAGVVVSAGERATIAVGERVVAIGTGCFDSHVTVHQDLVAPISGSLSFEAAASVPLVFLTVQQSLQRAAKLRSGERVLIHAAAGGVGLAAVQVARSLGAEVYGSTRSPRKRALLETLGVRVVDSSSTGFADELMRLTGGQGVDVVLNSLAGDFIPASLGVLKRGGRFIEIGKTGIWSAEQVAALDKEIDYQVVALDALVEQQPALAGSMLEELMGALGTGEIEPLPLQVYTIEETVAAFRLMQLARHVGKVVVTHQAPLPSVIRADASYLVTGGLGGLGLEVAQWLADKGARSIWLLGRRPPSPDKEARLQRMRDRGANVVVLSADVSDVDQLRAALARATNEQPGLRGVIHAAGVVDDGLFLQQPWDSARRVLEPKALGARNLLRMTRSLPLDFFVCFSSLASVIGNAGQSAYAAANAWIDALVEQRKCRGMQATAINWGPWNGIGMADGLDDRARAQIEHTGISFLPVELGLDALDDILSRGVADQVVVVDARWEKLAELGSPQDRQPLTELLLRRTPSEPAERQAGDEAAPQSSTPALGDLLRAAPRDERRTLLLKQIEVRVRRVMALPPGETIDPDVSLREIGLDSLLAVEIRNSLQQMLECSLPATLLFDYPSMSALAAYVERTLGVEDAPVTVAPVAAPAADKTPTEDDPIAIVGIGCRFPGGVRDPDSYWRTLRCGAESVGRAPSGRLEQSGYKLPEHSPLSADRAGYLDRIDLFDPDFFGLVPREAQSIDPRQRLLLEVAWEALQHAGQPLDQLSGSRTGVFVGMGANAPSSDRLDEITPHTSTGVASSVAAGRISYLLGLQGPSMVIDTACSSSLVATHLACQSLRSGESTMALAGGVSLMVSPFWTIALGRSGMLAVDGRCKTFDAAANGYVRAEGCGVVVLKRLSAAVADGDTVLALVRSSAVNQDGRTSSLTAPSSLSQVRVLREALEGSSASASKIAVLEAHGTGTPLGDPIELQAMHEVLGAERAADRRLAITSAKTNVGHLEMAAGMAGLIKLILSVHHGEIPPHLNLETLNPHIDFVGFSGVVPGRLLPWPTSGVPRMGGVSSFGFSGTNAHVVVEEAPARSRPRQNRPTEACLLALSGKQPEELRELAARYAQHLTEEPEVELRAVCHTATRGRAQYEHRLALVAETPGQASRELLAFARAAEGELPETVSSGRQAGRGGPRVAFLFSGQGSQYAGMGRQLYQRADVFRETIDRCAELLSDELDRPLTALLFESADAALSETRNTQPALFAFECALARQWQAWGIEPAAVTGHSVGEYSAACIAGVFSLEAGLRLIAQRGRLMQRLPAGGKMVAVGLDEASCAELLADHEKAVSIAALNGATQTVISGAGPAIDKIAAILVERGVRLRQLDVSHAFHSPLMEPMLGPFARTLAGVALAEPSLPIASNVTGDIANEEIASADYWVRHVRAPVRFVDGLQAIDRLGIDAYLEIGPHPTLIGLGKRSVQRGQLWVGSLKRDRDDWPEVLSSLAELYVRGADVDWEAVQPTDGEQKIPLPSHPYRRQRCWPEGDLWTGIATPAPRAAEGGEPQLLLGRPVRSPLFEGVIFDARYQASALPILGEHRYFGATVAAGALHLVRALQAVDALGLEQGKLRNVRLTNALVLGDDQPMRVQLVVGKRDGEGVRSLRVFSTPDQTEAVPEEWTLHARAEWAPASPTEQTISRSERLSSCPAVKTSTQTYDDRARRGLELGPRFRWISRLNVGETEAIAELRRPAECGAEEFPVPPGAVDSMLQVLAEAARGTLRDEEASLAPVGIRELSLQGSLETQPLWCHAVANLEQTVQGDVVGGDVRLYDAHDDLVLELLGVELSPITPEQLLGRRDGEVSVDECTFSIAWTTKQQRVDADADPLGSNAGGRWLVCGDGDGLGESVAELLRDMGYEATRVIHRAGAAFADPETLVVDDPLDVGGIAEQAEDLCGVVHLWPLDTANAGDLEQQLRLGVGSLLALAKAMAARREGRFDRKVWTVTRAAQQLAGDPSCNAEQAAVWGLARVVELEHPSIWGSAIDLAPDAGSGDEPELICQQLLWPDDEHQIAFRDGQRYVPRLRPERLPDAAIQLQADRTYVISGGTGALGIEIARWMVSTGGARSLLLLGRSAPSLERQATIAELRNEQVTIEVAQVDVTAAAALGDVLATARRNMPPLGGVVHAAGVADDGLLLGQEWERVFCGMAAKVAGALNLLELTREDPLEFCVLFSSIASVLGNVGQGSYAAANAFLDALPASREANRGAVPPTTVNWGFWQGLGMAAGLDADAMAEQGLVGLSVELGTEAFGRVAAAPGRTLLVSPVDATRLSNAGRSMLGELATAASSSREAADRRAPAAVEPAAAGTDPEDRVVTMTGLVTELTGNLLAVPTSKITPSTRFDDIGLNSLLALDLIKALEIRTKIEIPKVLLFEYQTVGAVAEYLAQQLG